MAGGSSSGHSILSKMDNSLCCNLVFSATNGLRKQLLIPTFELWKMHIILV